METTATGHGPGTGLLRSGGAGTAVVWLASIFGFMTVMDTSIVNVALPAMRVALHLTSADQQWVVDAYLLTLGGFMLLGARAGDMYGLRRVLAVGIVVFVLGSMTGGFAQDAAMLLIARAAQGLGGAILAPAGIALIIAARPDGPARSRALTVYQAVSAVAVTIAVVIGGLLTQELSWRCVMFINVTVGIGLLIAVLRLLDPAYRGRPGERLDVAGSVTITVAIGALIEGFANAQRFGWDSVWTVGFLVTGVLLVGVFVWIELRVEQPLVRLGIFTEPGIAVGSVILALNGTVLTASTLFLSLVLQSDLRYDALTSGIALLPYVLASVFAGFGAMILMGKIQARTLIAIGLLLAAVGYVWMGLLGSHPTYAANLLGPLIVTGIGLGAAVVPTTRAATVAVTPKDAALASGLFSLSRQLGSAIGIAALVTVAVAATTARATVGATAAAAGLHGNAVVFVVCGGICAVSALAAFLLPNRPAGPRAATAKAPTADSASH